MDRYKIGSGTLSLIMERYHAGGIPIEELQMMPPKEVELLFYPQKNIKKKDIPLPDFQYYYEDSCTKQSSKYLLLLVRLQRAYCLTGKYSRLQRNRREYL